MERFLSLALFACSCFDGNGGSETDMVCKWLSEMKSRCDEYVLTLFDELQGTFINPILVPLGSITIT